MNYDDKDRHIFSYFNGHDTVFCDPGATYRKLLALTGGKPNLLQNLAAKDVEKPDPKLKDSAPELYKQAEQDYAREMFEVYDAGEKLETMIRELFSMKPFDPATGRGAMLADCMSVWEEYKDFLNQKKTPPVNGQTSSTPSAGLPTTSPTMASTSVSS